MEREIAQAADLRRLGHEVAETRRRMLIGGSFYVLGWMLVCLFTPVIRVHTLASSLIALAFVGLALARILLKPPTEAAAEPMVRWLDVQWLIIQVSAAIWGGVVLWTLIDPVLTDARMALLVGAAGFATAIAHTYCMRFWPSLLAITVIYVPSAMLMWLPGHDQAVAFSLTVYFVYVISSLIRSHRDFHRRLDFEEELRQQRDRFAWLSRTDELTGLANRRRFVGELEAGIAQCKQAHGQLALLVLDIDHFKQINDAHGHAVGDLCLVAFAEQLKHVFAGSGEITARLGGEEFAVILPRHDEARAAARAEAFRVGLSAMVVVPGIDDLRVCVSIGVGEYSPLRYADGDRFLRAVDDALYRAKGAGRNRVERVGSAA